MLAQYLSVRLREPLALLWILRIHYLEHAFLHHAHVFFHVLRVFHRIPKTSAPDDTKRVSGHIHFFVPAQVRALLAGQHRLGHFEKLLHPAFFIVPVLGVTNLDCKQC
jgi:hypothetical protein